MEEKKKFRPTVSEYRALEEENERLKCKINEARHLYDLGGQLEGTSMIVKECDAWREKYRALVKEKEELTRKVNKLLTDYEELKASSITTDKYNALLSEKRTLEASNRHMENELGIMRLTIENDTAESDKIRREVVYLRNRNLWERIVNRKYEE